MTAAPLALLAELTHRCPLRCGYCSNPVALEPARDELDTGAWRRVLDEASELGALHVHFSGGEPARRHDLEALVAHAAGVGLYTNVITSGIGLSEGRLAALAAAGLDHVQLSLQHAEPDLADAIAGRRGAHRAKRAVADAIARLGLPLTVNVVLHRHNIEAVPALIELALTLGARRLELAHVQLYGFALHNRGLLVPTEAQVMEVAALVDASRGALDGRLAIDHVPPDHLARRPKACMGGWGRRFLIVTPTGRVLPCHAAETLVDLPIPSVRAPGSDGQLRSIWERSPAFQRFRGTDWMPEPCRGCERRELDHGGCRCQALAFTGDAAATDPACDRSPHHRRLRGLLPHGAELATAAPVPLARVLRRRARPRTEEVTDDSS